MAQARIIKGISVSPGLAMGPIHVVRATPNVIPTWMLRESEIEGEVQRLHEAVGTVADELDHQRRRVASQTNEKDAEIFAVHRMILLDQSAQGRVEDRIREERLNAEACVKSLIDHLERTLGGLDEGQLRGMGADVSDPWRTVLAELMKSERESFVSRGEKVVLAAAELTPYVAMFLDRERVLAIVTETGGRFSHGAVLARSLGFPCVVDIENLMSRLEQGTQVIIDGDRGWVQLRPDEQAVNGFLERLERRKKRVESLAVQASLPSVTPDGRHFGVYANIESLRDLDTFDLDRVEGIGLLRTEFLYMERSQFPSEEEQYRLYRRALERMEGREVTLRTLDIGGDKQLPYFKMPAEANPALGWRGLRVVLEWQDLLRVQLRAALRASAHGSLRLLLPMVTSIEEVRSTREIFEGVWQQLLDQGYEVADSVPVGIMIEVPSALVTLPEILQEVDFISVGTNDLVQYLLAVDRDNPRVSRLYEPYHPAVMRVLGEVAQRCQEAGKHSSICGEMSADYATAILFLGLGFNAVSVAPNFVPELKFAVRQVSFGEAERFAHRALGLGTAAEILGLVEEIRNRLHATPTPPGEPLEAGQEDPVAGA